MPRSSNKREEILRFLSDFSAHNGYSPTVREICAAVGLSSTASVYRHLEALRDEGLICMDGQKKRSITVPGARPGRVPVVGMVTAGVPILAVENIEGYIPWEGEEGCFALRVRGESMIEAGILSGDIIIVHRTPAAQNGEIVVALVEDEATVQRFYKENGHYRLQPENSTMEPIIVDSVLILGKVVALLREY